MSEPTEWKIRDADGREIGVATGPREWVERIIKERSGHVDAVVVPDLKVIEGGNGE